MAGCTRENAPGARAFPAHSRGTGMVEDAAAREPRSDPQELRRTMLGPRGWASAAMERARLLRTLRAAGRPLLVALVTFQFIGALAPAGIALATAFLVGRLLSTPGDALLEASLIPLSAYGLVIFVGRSTKGVTDALRYLTVQRVDGAHRCDLARLMATTPTIGVLERPQVCELLRVAQADRQSWVERTPGMGATAQLDVLIRMVGAAASCLVLARFAWWLVPMMAVPALASRAFGRRQCLRHIRMQRAGTMEGVRAEHWNKLATEWTGGKEVRTFGLADWAIARSLRHVLTMSQPRWTSEVRNNLQQWVNVVIVAPPLLAGFLLVTDSTVRGHSDVAILTAVFMASWSLIQSLGPTDVFDVEGGLVGLRAHEQLRDELAADAPPKSPLCLEESAPTGVAGSGGAPPLVRFEEVSFTYPGTDRAVIDALDLEIRPGELLAVVGLNGAGKSTLIKLLSGLYRPTRGRITADGRDIGRYRPHLWRRRLSVVFQDFVKYPLSAAENISFGRADVPPDHAAMTTAVREAGVEPLLAGLPEGPRTPLSRTRTNGVDLSGGQWQQVVLTRALYAVHRGARVLVLDEPTAHLDVRTEFEVFQRLAGRRGEASIVLISHRLSTVRQADRIVLLEGGRISESGTHDELMARGGAYARMFLRQAKRFNEGLGDRTGEGQLL